MFKIRSGLFREAAMRIDGAGTTYSCNALSYVCRVSYGFVDKGQDHVKTHLITDAYARLISRETHRAVKIRDFEYDNETLAEDRLPLTLAKEHRVMALLMVGEAWEDLEEGRKT